MQREPDGPRPADPRPEAALTDLERAVEELNLPEAVQGGAGPLALPEEGPGAPNRRKLQVQFQSGFHGFNVGRSLP